MADLPSSDTPGSVKALQPSLDSMASPSIVMDQLPMPCDSDVSYLLDSPYLDSKAQASHDCQISSLRVVSGHTGVCSGNIFVTSYG